MEEAKQVPVMEGVMETWGKRGLVCVALEYRVDCAVECTPCTTDVEKLLF